MLWIILAAIYAAAAIASFIVFWREAASFPRWARPPFPHFIGFGLLWWFVWPGRLAIYTVDEWRIWLDRRASRKALDRIAREG